MSLTCEVCGETYPNEHKVGCREFLLKENARLKTELDLQKAITVEAKRCPICRCEEGAYHIQNCIFMDRDRWKALCEKMAEAIRRDVTDEKMTGTEAWIALHQALALYDAEMKK